MKTRLFVAAAGVALAALGFATASSASAITITTIQGYYAPGSGVLADETLITGFNSTGGTVTNDAPGVSGTYYQGGTIDDLASGFTFTQDSGAYTRQVAAGLDSGLSSPPPSDPTDYYETVLGGGSATLTSTAGLSQFSFYMGSPDTYNGMQFTFTGAGGTTTLTGDQIWCQAPGTPSCVYPGGGDQTLGFTVIYNFSPGSVNTVEFTSSGNSFEFDSLGGIAVPEPATWSMMIMGFGMAGGLMRAQRRKQALA